MSDQSHVVAKRLGILGDFTDPVAQLLEDVYDGQPVEFVELSDPNADIKYVDEVLILSQAVALAHMRALSTCGTPCKILLRRHGPVAELPTWQLGLAWFSQCLAQVDWPDCELLALTPTAAKGFKPIAGRQVLALSGLRRLDRARPTVRLARGQEVITFSLSNSSGARETRRADLEIFNWVRLRRLAHLSAEDPLDLDLADLVEFANGGHDAAPVLKPQTPPCILAVVPNGVGLGHVTRMMSIAKALDKAGQARVVFWSFSRAAEIMQAAGFEVILRQTAAHLGAHPPDWRLWETLEFAKTIRQLKPNAISYDGGTFDKFMTDALRQPGCGRVGVLWVRRGMLRPDTDAQLLEMEQYCDLVLEPGDLAVEMDQGPTRTRQAQNRGFSRQITTQPVTLKPFMAPYGRREAKRKLRLGWGAQCLVSLGGAFGDWDQLKKLLVQNARKFRVKLVWAQSPLAAPPQETDSTTTIRQLYPLNRYFNAFDGLVSATGYNSYHELMLGYDGPVLFAPTNNIRLDDQEARAGFAGDKGWASVVFASRPDDQSQVIEGFMRQVSKRETITCRPAEAYAAPDMAREILNLCDLYAC